MDAFAATPELLELTSTPFMTKIVVTIMPDLQKHTSTPASAKSELILRTSEAVAELSPSCKRWGLGVTLSKFRVWKRCGIDFRVLKHCGIDFRLLKPE